MTKEERYKEAKFILDSVAETLNRMVCNDGEDITCYFAGALDEPIQSLIKAKTYMAVAEYQEAQDEPRKH